MSPRENECRNKIRNERSRQNQPAVKRDLERHHKSAGGTQIDQFNVRLLRHALKVAKGTRPQVSSLRALFSRLLSRQPELRAFNRTPLTDEEVRNYIRKALSCEPAARPTPLLRCLRDSGLACEHGRFSTLFREVEGARDG